MFGLAWPEIGMASLVMDWLQKWLYLKNELME